MSEPVAVVVAGIVFGSHGMRSAMSEQTRQHLKTFWLLVNDTLNALLFLLIALRSQRSTNRRSLAAMASMVPVTLAVRWVSVTASALPLNLRLPDRSALSRC